jgi:hypothetical protein
MGSLRFRHIGSKAPLIAGTFGTVIAISLPSHLLG